MLKCLLLFCALYIAAGLYLELKEHLLEKKKFCHTRGHVRDIEEVFRKEGKSRTFSPRIGAKFICGDNRYEWPQKACSICGYGRIRE